MAGLTGWHLLILLAVVMLLFGAKRLPDMARAVGQSTRILKSEMKDTAADKQTRGQPQQPVATSSTERAPHPLTPVRLNALPQPTSDTTHQPSP
ncbi:MAG TPA: Sec-independent protein translocase subunit TatA [Pseudonocardiaceae bacterium]|nr:Sec-independent protein translocase subunit TatA [Pseudonocardiaceae bacterium]